jgi:hypothetical protein
MERAPRRLTLRGPRPSVKPASPGPRGRLRPRWDVGSNRHSFGGNSVGGAADPWSVQGIRIFFVFIDFQRQEPAPAMIAAASASARN